MRLKENRVGGDLRTQMGSRMRWYGAASAVAAILALGAPAALAAQTIAKPVGQAPQVSLPGGASTLTETHGNWTVACEVKDNKKRCEFSQAIGNKKTGRRILSIELQPVGGDAARGVILAPFGLNLATGITLKVDNKEVGRPLAFTTCVDAGCVVPISFDAQTMAQVAKGNVMTVNATAAGNGQAVSLKISLKGFTAARNRAAQIMK